MERYEIATVADIEEIEKIPLEERLTVHNTYDMIRQGASIDPDAPAMSLLLSGDKLDQPVRVTYAEFLAKVTQTANLLHDLGIGPGDVVTYLLPNLTHTHYVIWGGEAAGIVNPINPMLEPATMKHICEAAGTKVLVALGEYPGTDMWEKALAVRKELPDIRAHHPRDGAQRREARHLRVRRGDLQVQRGQARLRTGHRSEGDRFHLPHRRHHGHTETRPSNPLQRSGDPHDPQPHRGPQPRRNDHVRPSPVPRERHDGDRRVPLRHRRPRAPALAHGIPGPHDPSRISSRSWNTTAPSPFPACPTVLSVLLDVPVEGTDISSLRWAICGAAPLSVELFKRFEAHSGMKILEGYGLTEGTLVSSINPLYGERKVGSIGLRIPYQGMKIFVEDATGWREAATGEIGCVCVKGPNVFPGYLEEEHNKGVWLEDGWFNTGDLGRQDADGTFWLTGRKKELIIRGGHNIDPLLIEDPLYKLPGVQVAAAVGRPDAHAGEVPVAYVQIQEGSGLTAEKILEHLKKTVGERAAIPKEVILLDEVPLTPVGKIFKPALRWDAIRRVYEKELEALGDTAESVEVDGHRRQGPRLPGHDPRQAGDRNLEEGDREDGRVDPRPLHDPVQTPSQLTRLLHPGSHPRCNPAQTIP